MNWLTKLFRYKDVRGIQEELDAARRREQYFDLQGANYRSVLKAHERVKELEKELEDASRQ